MISNLNIEDCLIWNRRKTMYLTKVNTKPAGLDTDGKRMMR